MSLLKIEIGNEVMYANLANTEAAKTLQKYLEKGNLVISVSNYGGWEKVGDLPWRLPQDDKQIHADYGDIMLYNGSSIVFFYGGNDWAYTRLGKIIDDGKDLNKILSGNENTVILSVE